ncbi:acyl-CoA dehydrogenase family protein [Actinomycetospora termitidis]|uniref:Acyl-CoA dehydrogenase family protein n=1 Tax=Actinomycetospora termitidis TaxID=3053470 RepID=A0ABT7MGY6_9PSEU|nr:acyl-CoA dehydrogenase family protein [Actinomycetospora sp. Odt1-22]MDL5159701.1 acyl-CoA dehydrogenase family protein [Actinomycetospora sp. Odt1-22]
MADHDEYGAAVDDYLGRSYAERRHELLERGGWDPALASEFADLGWYSLAVPEEQGGLGVPLAALGPVFLQYGRHLVRGPMLEHSALPALVPGLAPATGARPPALVDPGVTDLWADDLGTITRRGPRLDGTVEAVRFAAQADRLVVVAGAAVCLVDPATRGVSIEPLAGADPGVEFARVEFDDVEAGTVLQDEDMVVRLRSWARLLLACELSGLARGSVERTVEHVARREQFGRPIGSFQAVKHLVADMHTRSTALENLCLAALGDADTAPPTELDLLACTAKAHASDVAVRVCEDAIQLHGGMGFTTESDVSWFYRRALALRGWYGDPTELQVRLGATLLDRIEEHA